MKVNKDYIIAMELEHLVKDKNNKYILVTGLFESQYEKLKEKREKIINYLEEVIGIKNNLEIIFDKRVNF